MASSQNLDTITAAFADLVSGSPSRVDPHNINMDFINRLFDSVSIGSEVVQTNPTTSGCVVNTLPEDCPAVMKQHQHKETFEDKETGLNATLISVGSGSYVSATLISTGHMYKLTVFNAPDSQYLYASRSRVNWNTDIGDMTVMVDSMSYSSSTSVNPGDKGKRNVHVSYSCCKQFAGSDVTIKSYFSCWPGCNPVTYQYSF
jgi:hypothetical protein